MVRIESARAHGRTLHDVVVGVKAYDMLYRNNKITSMH